MMAKRNTSKTPKTYRVRVVNPSRPGAPRFMGESNPTVRKVEAFSKHRYRASPEERRRYGGSTVTQFYVRYVDAPHETKEIMGYGKTPGERKTDAIRKFRQHESTPNPRAPKPKKTGNYVVTFVPHAEEPQILVRYIGDYAGGGEVSLDYEYPEDAKKAWDGIRGDMDVELELAKQGFDTYGNDLRARASRSRTETPRYNPKEYPKRYYALTHAKAKSLGLIDARYPEFEGLKHPDRDWRKYDAAATVSAETWAPIKAAYGRGDLDDSTVIVEFPDDWPGVDPTAFKITAASWATSTRNPVRRSGVHNPQPRANPAQTSAGATSARARTLSRRITG